MIITAQNPIKKRIIIHPVTEFIKNNTQEKNPIIIPHTTAVAINDFVIGMVICSQSHNVFYRLKDFEIVFWEIIMEKIVCICNVVICLPSIKRIKSLPMLKIMRQMYQE